MLFRSKNDYKFQNSYSSTNPDALATGDEFGKGQISENGTVGSLSDIKERNKEVAINRYNSKKNYKDSLNGA